MRQLIRLCILLLLLTPSHPLVATGDILEYEEIVSIPENIDQDLASIGEENEGI